MRYIMLSLLLCSCMVAQENSQPLGYLPFEPYVDAAFADIVNEFEDDYHKYTGDIIEIRLPINFVDIPNPNYIGLCWFNNGGVKIPHIQIDRSKWELMSDWRRKAVLYHELGHCVLGRRHTNNKNSLMQPTVIRGKVFEFHEDTLLKELFQ